MKLAFLISTDKDAHQLRNLIYSLPDDAVFFIHIDSKRDLQHFKQDLLRENITFINHHIGGKASSYLEHCRYRGVDGVVAACVQFRGENNEVGLASSLLQ